MDVIQKGLFVIQHGFQMYVNYAVKINKGYEQADIRLKMKK